MSNFKPYDKVFRYYIDPELFYSEFGDRHGDYWIDYKTLYKEYHYLLYKMIKEGYNKEVIMLRDKEIDYVAISPDY